MTHYNDRSLTDHVSKTLFSEHRTGTGEMVHIYQMNDGHLANTIRMIFRAVNDVLERGSSLEGVDPVYDALYGEKTYSAEEVAYHLKGHVGQLQPYLLEAGVRNVNHEWDWAFKELRTALGRNTRVGRTLITLEPGHVSLERTIGRVTQDSPTADDAGSTDITDSIDNSTSPVPLKSWRDVLRSAREVYLQDSIL